MPINATSKVEVCIDDTSKVEVCINATSKVEVCIQWRIQGGSWGGCNPPPFRP